MVKKRLVVTAILLVFLFGVFVGCAPKKENNSSANPHQNQSGNSTATSVKYFAVGKAFSINGGMFRVDRVEEVDRIKNNFSGGYYRPKSGKFLVIYYTFKGNGHSGAFNTDSIRIKVNGKLFAPSSNVDIATDYAHQKGVSPLSFALWSNKTSKKFLDVYDIPETDALSICWFGSKNGKAVELAEVRVDNLKSTSQSIAYQYAPAKEWLQVALKKAHAWHDDLRIYMIQGSNVSIAESVDFAEGRDKPERLKLAPTDGKALYWEYFFISPSDKDYLYIIEISDGKVVKSKKSGIAALFVSPKEMLLPSQIKLDSKDAVDIAMNALNSNRLDRINGLLMKYVFSYPLEFKGNSGKHIPVWTVEITTFSKSYFKVYINANSGEVLKKYIKES